MIDQMYNYNSIDVSMKTTGFEINTHALERSRAVEIVFKSKGDDLNLQETFRDLDSMLAILSNIKNTLIETNEEDYDVYTRNKY